MSSVPEYINKYFSKITGLRLITKKDFDFFYNTLDELVEEKARVSRAHSINNNVLCKYLSGGDDADDKVQQIKSIIQPKKVLNASKIRIGRANDGGYVCLDYFNDITAAVSLGIDNDVSWDLELANRGVRVFQYDHTVDGPPINNELFKFHKIKVGHDSGDEVQSLNTILSKNSILKPNSVFLKIDIEGDEWETFLQSTDNTLNAFTQIVCEFHNLNLIDNRENFQKIMSVFAKLKSKFDVYHIHGNNYGPLLLTSSGQSIPDVVEISFGNKEVFQFGDVENEFPTIFDAPCNPNMIDYYIKFNSQ